MEAGALGGDELADGAEDAYGGVFFFGGWCFLDGEVLAGAGFRAVGRGIGEGPITIGAARREKCQNSRSVPTHPSSALRKSLSLLRLR